MGRKFNEYYMDNLDSLLKYQKSYYENNKEKKINHQNEYSIKNKEKIADYKKIYRENNKQKIKDYQNKKFNCVCGGKYTNQNKLCHENSVKHLKYINNLNNA